jgi:hypothetical protein
MDLDRQQILLMQGLAGSRVWALSSILGISAVALITDHGLAFPGSRRVEVVAVALMPG